MQASRLRMAIPMLYVAAIVISLFAGGLVPVLIVGAVLSGIAYAVLGGGGARGAGRARNRNRNRNRDRS